MEARRARYGEPVRRAVCGLEFPSRHGATAFHGPKESVDWCHDGLELMLVAVPTGLTPTARLWLAFGSRLASKTEGNAAAEFDVGPDGSN